MRKNVSKLSHTTHPSEATSRLKHSVTSINHARQSRSSILRQSCPTIRTHSINALVVFLARPRGRLVRATPNSATSSQLSLQLSITHHLPGSPGAAAVLAWRTTHVRNNEPLFARVCTTNYRARGLARIIIPAGERAREMEQRAAQDIYDRDDPRESCYRDPPARARDVSPARELFPRPRVYTIRPQLVQWPAAARLRSRELQARYEPRRVSSFPEFRVNCHGAAAAACRCWCAPFKSEGKWQAGVVRAIMDLDYLG